MNGIQLGMVAAAAAVLCASAFAQTPFTAARAASTPSAAGAGATISNKDVKQNITTFDKQQKQDTVRGNRADQNPAAHGLKTEVGPGTWVDTGKSGGKATDKGVAGAVGNAGPVKGGKYGDTFGGQRANNSMSGGSTRNYAGNGKGRTSTGLDDLVETIGDMLRDAGGTPTGDPKADAAELEYAQKVGSDGYAATKNMNAGERRAYWETQEKKQHLGTRPRPDDDLRTGSFVPLTRQDVTNAGKAAGAKKDAAGGAGDERTDQQGSGGGTATIVRGKAEGAERERASGPANPSAVFKINQVADPVPAAAK